MPTALSAGWSDTACELAQAGVDPRQLREQAALEGPALEAAAKRTIGPWLDGIEASQGDATSRT
jgi:hypothetical protein